MSDYIHPESGELLATEEEWRAALNDVEDRLAYLYRLRRSLRDGEEGALKVAELPEPRYRTDKQNAVARCPRCGGRLEKDEG